MWATLRQASRPSPAQIVALFHARFDPRADVAAERARRARSRVSAAIEAALAAVESLDEDRILRRFVNAVQAALRTNFYQLDADGQPKRDDRDQVRQPQDRRPAAAAAALRDLRLFAARRGRAPALRQGRARRHPLVGPAAGFPHRGARPRQGAAGQERRDRAGRRQGRLRAEAPAVARPRARPCRPKASPPTSCSSRRLLDITDNLGRRGRRAARQRACATTTTIPISWSPPTRAPRPSPTSPTRSRSEHGFWLGDAFASGGSAGYDHKKMGITARGAWEAVKRHFREMDVDIGKTPFTVVGVGDMSGDVFGNGMLREQHRSSWSPPSTTATSSSIPTPDPETSFAERKRLFDLPRSSWQDYDKALISTGGGVFSAQRQGDRAVAARRRRAARLRQAEGDAAGGDERDPQGAGRSAVVRRHRHLCARLGGDRRGGRRPRQRCDPRHRRRLCAAR